MATFNILYKRFLFYSEKYLQAPMFITFKQIVIDLLGLHRFMYFIKIKVGKLDFFF